MSLLIFFIFLSVAVSFLCSMLEAIILSVTPSYVASLKKQNPKLYGPVKKLRSDIERPLSSILTFNTIAHTVGAAGAGAEAQRIFGSDSLAIFSTILTFIILFFSEIIPKSIGHSSWKPLLPISIKILKPMVMASIPIVWLSQKISSLFKQKKILISRDEISAMADIGLSDGILDKDEHRTIKEVIKFRKLEASQIMTPKELVQSLNISDSIEEAYGKIQDHTFSRILVTGEEKDNIKGYILRSRLLSSYINDKKQSISTITNPILIVKNNSLVPGLYKQLSDRREHISAIVDSNNKFIGIVSHEDVIEHMIGFEIFDELDQEV